MASTLSLSRVDLLRDRAFLGGAWIGDPKTAGFIVDDPATGQPIAHIFDAGSDTARMAVDAACLAFADWSRTTAHYRSQLLRRWHDLILAHADDLARLISLEQGKPLAEADAEVNYGASYIEWFAEEAKRSYGDIVPAPVAGQQILVSKEPVGVAAIITPWNFPLAMIARKCGPALAAGCTTVIKPASETPLTALALAVLADEAGIPSGVLNVVPSTRASEIADAWLEDVRVRKLSFTGSTRVGKILARKGAETMKRLSLELGGDAPFIVFDDADLAVAVAALVKAKFRNAGQACIAANRVYVQAGVHDRFLDMTAAAIDRLSVGAAANGAFDIGPLISDRALREVEALVTDAQQRGAQTQRGGRRHPLGGRFFMPTLLAEVTRDMRLSCEEIFGPVVAVSRFDTEEEAIRLANDSRYGLAAYLFSGDPKRIARVSRDIETGMIGINEGAISTAVAPFGGIKESGYGREGSRYGLADYQNIKYLCIGALD